MWVIADRGPFVVRRRSIRRNLVLAGALLATPLPAKGQWESRLIANYQTARLGASRSENSYQELLARRTYQLNEVNLLTVTARLRRDEDHLDREHVFTGQVDGDLRSPSWNLYFRHRPTQSPGVTQPADWRRRETVLGGSLALDGFPLLLYEESRRRRSEGDTLVRKSSTLDRRITSTWMLGGVNLDASHRQTENGSPAGSTPGSRIQRQARDTGGGADWSHSFSEGLQAGAGYRMLRSRWETVGRLDRHARYQRAETNLTFLPWRTVNLAVGSSWQETRQRENGNAWRRDRLLDFTSSLSYQPNHVVSTTLIRTFQEQKNPGLPANRLDYARAQVAAIGRILPELELSGAFSRNWTLSQRGLSAPSNQASFGLRGDLRRGISLAYTLTGQALEGVAKAFRHQVSQSADLRLLPSQNSRLSIGVQTFRLGEKLTLRHHDNVHYRVDGLLSGSRGASVSMTYASQVLRAASANEKFSFAGQVSVPWKRWLLSGTGTAVRAGTAIARQGRPWGVSASPSLRARLYRRSDLTVSYTRSLPARGSGSSIWQAVLTQRFR